MSRDSASEVAWLQHRVGLLIRDQRKTLGWSVDRLARECGMQRAFVAQVQRGSRNVSLGSVAAMLHAMGCQLSVGIVPASAEKKEEGGDGNG